MVGATSQERRALWFPGAQFAHGRLTRGVFGFQQEIEWLRLTKLVPALT